jgi:hypothetical protein
MRDYERGTPVEPADMPIRNDGTYQDVNEPVPEPMCNIKPFTKQQLLSDYEIRIRFPHKGCIVSVGCKEIAFSTTEEAMSAIQEYVESPEAVGGYWREQFNMV